MRVPGGLVGRFHRMQRTYLEWWPPESPLRIGYSNEVVREAARADKGVLYGTRDGTGMRVIAVRREQAVNRDPRLNGLELLGTFASRARGEIFLTDPDLEHLEMTGGSIALVISGTKAGFFVYQPDGTIETIKSYREFSFAAPGPKRKLQKRRKAWAVAAGVALLIALIFEKTPRTRPLALSIRDEAGQLIMTWNPPAAPARLEIADGGRLERIPVAGLASATYVRRSGDVQVRLVSGARSETAHFVAVDPQPPLQKEVARLEAEASALRGEIERGRGRIESLRKQIRRRLK